jgi:hypothetical protein
VVLQPLDCRSMRHSAKSQAIGASLAASRRADAVGDFSFGYCRSQVRILLPRPPAFASPLRVKRWRIESFGDPSGMRGPTRYVQRRNSARRGYVIFFI